ncbi:hydrogen peroxide-inducible genes activator [Rhizobium sp. L1K21]|uniref:hydrogen peroxide-inducible genes activator n=1 Tax=Rhizobium sp. L1K21 TaxID=2954933 RepID=UPI0020931A69|nr:hydrogen peroxide-inducible genes activator [Rhizobium sp. L1K21]MCO6188653.1 LysR substrate-binding domain-containing protein [Rhizobium sp. L1K21]
MEKPLLPTIRQLQYFQALAIEKNFRKASESVGVSQPSLSEQINNLESILQTPLVERGRGGAVLTASGREVLSRIDTILEDIESLVRVAQETRAGISGTYRLGASTTLGPYLLPSVVRLLHAEHPELRLYIRDGQPRELLQDLQAGRLDLLLTQLPVHASELEVTRLFREPLRLAVARDHRLAGHKDTKDIDLAGETLLVLSNGYMLHTQLVELASTVGATLRQDYEGSSLDALRQMVAMNMGVTLLPALYANSEAEKEDGGVALVPFRRGSVTRSIGLVTRRSSRNPAAFKAFSDAIKQVVRSDFSTILQPYA